MTPSTSTATTTAAANVEIYKKFNLKTDDDYDAAAEGPQQKQRQGRVYSKTRGEQPSGIQLEDMIFGIQMAHLSCTDDSEERLQGSGANTIEALRVVVGTSGNNQEEDTTHRKPLSTILQDQFGLMLDCWMDESGLRRGRAVDTQGFIASNDDIIVLSYRFSTSGLDWITNLSMTSSEWEPNVDEGIGHAGYCSCFDGLYTKYCLGHGKPRVHTGFYNNFVYTIPMIRKYILQPLLQPNCKPKKVYICGCSLGAAIATLAFCFLLHELPLEDPDFPSHKIIGVTAGSPRVCDAKMQQKVMERMKLLRPLDRAVLCRLVYNHDLVPHIPLHLMMTGFIHLDKLVYITQQGDVIVNPRLENSQKFAEVKKVFRSFWATAGTKKEQQQENTESGKDASGGGQTSTAEEKTPFEVEVKTTPGPIKDHMPYWYLTWLQKLKATEDGKPYSCIPYS